MAELDEVAPGVWVATSRRECTTSTLVESDGAVLLIDPAWDPDELEGLADEIAQRRWTVVAGISTHAHHDHLLWHPRFGDVPRYASRRTVELARTRRDQLVGELGRDWPEELAGLVGRVVPGRPFLHDEPIDLVVHDGHCPGHTAVWLPRRSVLVAGDMLSDTELPLPFDPDDLSRYTAGLDILEPYVRRAGILVPGHGRPTDAPVERLRADRGYLADPDRSDPRVAYPGMADVHERIRALSPSSSDRRSTRG